MSALFVFVLFSLSLQNDAKIVARYPRYEKQSWMNVDNIELSS